jgi:hypothetical protein
MIDLYNLLSLVERFSHDAGNLLFLKLELNHVAKVAHIFVIHVRPWEFIVNRYPGV